MPNVLMKLRRLVGACSLREFSLCDFSRFDFSLGAMLMLLVVVSRSQHATCARTGFVKAV
ncbi:hypothetical protein [Bradyrhizobium iriomotense]|uniref:hypothetical protein n=1 Tax=Bradyrhizobium iriomotense TaxID=441950 RepID=UPI0024E15F6F|nr:hypothetical protein [Bradyrhizobium iriomotense]